MSTQDDDYRAFSYWPSKDERRVISIKRDPETDAMTDEDLVRRDLERKRPGASGETHLVTRERNGHQSIAVVHRTPENEQMTDEELLDQLDDWRRPGRHLRAVDDE